MSTILFPVDFIENQIPPPDLKRICRLCMGYSPVMSDIFMDLEGQPVNEFIMELFPVRIQRGEKLPESVCSLCLEKLVMIRQFRMLCLHSDRCLRNELGTMLQNQSNLNVLPVSSINQHFTSGSNETFIDSSGNQVILLTNPKDIQNNCEEPQTIYILQQEGTTYQAQEEEVTTPVKKAEELILIEDDDSEIVDALSEEDSDNEVVITDVVEKKKRKSGQNRTNVDSPVAHLIPKKSKTTDDTTTVNSSNNNGPEFQFVDINADSAIVETENENLIEILEDERNEVKMCDKCCENYSTTTLEHNLVCVLNHRECQFCGLGELNVLDFDKHIREMHIKDFRVCQTCRLVFLEEKHFNHHHCKSETLIEFDVNNYTCAFCRASFDNLKGFTHHYYKEHHKKSNCLCSSPPK